MAIRSMGDLPQGCEKGAIVSVTGQASATAYEYKDKSYAKLQIYGRIEVVCPAPFAQEKDDPEDPPAPPAAPIARGTKAQPGLPLAAPKVVDDSDDDSVPF